MYIICGVDMMQTEHQNIEWKEKWKDEYLRWICGFANAQGGKIYVGVDDKGTVVGVENVKKLLEDIPNKVQNTLGIITDVNLHEAAGKQYLEIVVAPSDYPVNYKGEYHYRTGSTKQLLQGPALTQFLIKKSGYKWDSAVVENVSIEELDAESFEIFRKEALRSGRISESDTRMPNAELLSQLGMLSDGKLKRAAVLLFHRHPERYLTGCYIKIGKFGIGADLQYQDEIRGSFLLMADRVVDIIYLKYLTALISYDNEVRIETYPYPREAIREIVFNALIHSNWADHTPIQIRIEEDAMYISNSCILPLGWSAQTLLERHQSKPYNPDIANVFFRAGYVESWGRGIQKVCEACEKHGNPPPIYSIIGECMTVELKTTKLQETKSIPDNLLALYRAIKTNPKITYVELAQSLHVGYKFVATGVKTLKEKNLIERVGSDRKGHWVVKGSDR